MGLWIGPIRQQSALPGLRAIANGVRHVHRTDLGLAQGFSGIQGWHRARFLFATHCCTLLCLTFCLSWHIFTTREEHLYTSRIPVVCGGTLPWAVYPCKAGPCSQCTGGWTGAGPTITTVRHLILRFFWNPSQAHSGFKSSSLLPS